jgi:hypothetical protein
LFSKVGNNALKKYGGTKILHALESNKRKQIIYDYIVKTERDYTQAMFEYRKSLEINPNRQERVISKILCYFVEKQIKERTFDNELEIIDNAIEKEIPLPENNRNKEALKAEANRKYRRMLKKTQ